MELYASIDVKIAKSLHMVIKWCCIALSPY